MSIHPSLTISEKDKKQRSVLKRTERIRAMSEKGKWIEGDMVYGLPKLKTVRIKIKKEKAEKVETAATPGATAEAVAPAGKEAPVGKSAPKSQEKK